MSQQNPPPKDIDADPVGYIRYVLDDTRSLVENASPDAHAITRRLDCIEAVLPMLELKCPAQNEPA